MERTAKMRKTVFTAIFLFAPTLFSQTDSLYDYVSLKNNLLSGIQVRVVVHYGTCTVLIEGEPIQEPPDAIGGMNIDTFEIFSKGVFENEYEYLSFSGNSLVLLRERHVINYVKFRVFENDSVSIRAQYVDPLSYEVLMDEEFLTMIRDEKGNGGVLFFSCQ
ncbi:hypothetical protein JXA84_05425 [candidate division WOR-3 bacterium]|nr:hypothetical protein [candidate division WOR-3 bacterium]